MKKLVLLIFLIIITLAVCACSTTEEKPFTPKFIESFELPDGMDEADIGFYFYNNNYKEFVKEIPTQNTGYFNKNFSTLIYFAGENDPNFLLEGRYNRTETTYFDNWALSGHNVAVFYYNEFFGEGGLSTIEKFFGSDGKDLMNYRGEQKTESGLKVSLAEIFAYYYVNTFPKDYLGAEVEFSGNDEGAVFALAATDYLMTFKDEIKSRLLPQRIALLDMPYIEETSDVTVNWTNKKIGKSMLSYIADTVENLQNNYGIVFEIVESDVQNQVGTLTNMSDYERLLNNSVSLDYIASFLEDAEKEERTASRDWYLLSMTSTGVSSYHYDYVRKDTGASYAYALSPTTITSFIRALQGTAFKSENVTAFALDIKQRSSVSNAGTKIFGYAFFDKDEDGSFDDGPDSRLSSVKIVISSANGFYKVVTTDEFGYYEVNIEPEYVSSSSVTFSVNFKTKEGYVFYKPGTAEATGVGTATAKIYNWVEVSQGYALSED